MCRAETGMGFVETCKEWAGGPFASFHRASHRSGGGTVKTERITIPNIRSIVKLAGERRASFSAPWISFPWHPVPTRRLAEACCSAPALT